MKNTLFALAACFLGALVTFDRADADVALPHLFGDHMVLQRDAAVPVWGTASPDEKVTVSIDKQSVRATADAQGQWRVKLEPLTAGGPLDMTIKGTNTITIKDILVGEVWICSGQSNMALQVQRAQNPEKEIQSADHPTLRLFLVKPGGADEPRSDVGGEWKVCSPATVAGFSAVGYFFGRDLQSAIHVPVGLIDSSVGGTPAESWTPRGILEAEPAFQPILESWQRRIAAAKAALEAEKDSGAGQGRPQNRANRRNRAVAGAASRPAAASGPAQSPAQLLNSSQRPSVLYNAMIHPLIPYAIRGVIWYQGESNSGYAYQYRKLFAAMIKSWRAEWGEGDFPFFFVQLAPFRAGQKDSFVSAWAELREAQLMTLSLPATAMAVITDIGDAGNIHPTNKQDVGKRLSLAARALVHGEKIEYSGPSYESMTVEGDRVRLRFTHAEGGLAARGGAALQGFAVAGEDKKFVDADATIEGNAVVVHSDKVPHPVAVRYAWADVPVCNLVNKADLPASPFRTDDWPGLTTNKNQMDAVRSDSSSTYRVRRIQPGRIKLDGKLDEAPWSKARAENRFTFPWSREKAPRTEFRALWDGQFLYFSYDVQDADVFILDKLRDEQDGVFEDRVEIYLSRDDAMKDYYCLEIDPRGRILDYRSTFPRKFDMSWQSEGVQAKGQTTKDGYCVEGRISLAALEKLGFAAIAGGSRLRAGLFRAEFSHDRSGQPAQPIDSKHTLGRSIDGPPPIEAWISWIDPKTPEPDFHVPASLGWLQFEE